MAEKYDPNTLWVALSEQSHDGNLFDVYPKLLAQLFLQEEAARQDGDTSEAEKLVLPSDKEWRLQLYFYLVEMQKNLESDEDGDKSQIKPVEEPPEEWAPWNLVVSTKNPHAPPPVAVKTAPGPVWDIGQVVKAARLLCKPPLHVDFTDEQEMRCVYSLIYDVYRYKSILDQALEDVDFLGDFPQYVEHRHAVWLFLMELARRRWGARPRKEMERAVKLLEKAGSPFKEIENEIWEQRVHFAAAIARIRIKNKAFSLSDLLPPHLREERILACNKNTVTGWVNTFKAKKVALLVKHLHELGYSYSNSQTICAGEYRFDRVCPRFITLRPPADVGIGKLDLVRDGVIVLQEREFCEGASTLCRALRANALRGVVAQTHASSPRCSAYLAAQLKELAAVLKAKAPAAPATPELGRLVVFGAGDKVESYVCALRELGIEASLALHSDAPVLVVKEQVYCDTPAVASALDGVVAALATPPNSYSAVTDPIDLVCGRGGDLAMLEILTESEIDGAGKARVQSILEEQKKTLRTLMSKPQIQLILYETHSALEAENQAQVTRAIAEANRLARERYALLKKRHRQTVSSPQKHATGADPANAETFATAENTTFSDVDKEDHTDDSVPSPKQPDVTPPSTNRSRPQSVDVSIRKPTDNTIVARTEFKKARPIPAMPQPGTKAIPKDPDHDNPNIYVPNCDLFESGTLPNLGNGLDINYILDRDGCYLGLIQRKEITRLDAKYMIRVAEERGLFGAGASPPPQPRRKKPEQTGENKRRQRKASFEVERVAAPTYASLSRQSRDCRGSAPACLGARRDMCERHARRHAAAAAISAAACTCDARHRPPIHPMQAPSKKNSLNFHRASPIHQNKPQNHRIHQYRRASADVKNTPHSPTLPCRRPFPLVVHDLRLKAILPQYKIAAIS